MPGLLASADDQYRLDLSREERQLSDHLVDLVVGTLEGPASVSIDTLPTLHSPVHLDRMLFRS